MDNKVKKNHKLFSKALFIQSCKANGIMWAIISVAVCFMLACVMIISGSSSISSIKDDVETTIIEEAIKSSVKKNTVNYYDLAITGESLFDSSFTYKFDELNSEENANTYNSYVLEQKTNAVSKIATLVQEKVSGGMSIDEATKETTEQVTKEVSESCENKFIEIYITPSYLYAVNTIETSFDSEILAYAKSKATNYDELSDEEKETYLSDAKTKVLGPIMVTINPNNLFDSEYEKNSSYGEVIPKEYITNFTSYMQSDVEAWSDGAKGDSLDNYITTSERNDYISLRAYNSISMIISSNMISDDVITELLNVLSSYGVTREKYDEMGFDYNKVHKISYEAMIEYNDKLTYEISLLDPTSETYSEDVKAVKANLNVEIAGSLLEKLPTDVAEGIEELGTMDLYGLIVGSIFFKMAGLLLPIIYLIMASNNLIAGQVDTGSMAYVLSTSTKRDQVTFTQALFLISSLFLMFVLTTITSIICINIANVQTSLTVGKLILINLGAFVTLFAMSGINFFTSCYFDRSKKAMALGGGISMFFLVATMLGLFGSPVIPSVVRITALNNFNYVSLISLFDVVSILDSTTTWIFKLLILVAIGLVGYILGAIRFKKKDLPL